MLEIVLKADDPVIGKVTNDDAKWPITNVIGQPYDRAACTCYTLPAPTGEHWFVVLPEGVSEFSITLEKPKKVKAAE
jgi:hypothetical protein